ncbi:Protein JTB [Chionoecetes opilio]|uniref:Protein JTB n=1 Tax=Chionoecetes opilio TaxID=41210 RepID=A0A8J4XYG2_CHIOP|nr:Protein JTB [Chionoecetes opilio]
MRVRRRHLTPLTLLILGFTLGVLTLHDLVTSDPRDVEGILARLTDRQLCWRSEKYYIAEPCDKCSDEDVRRNADLCLLTGYIQRVVCEASGYAWISCQAQEWEEELRFWAFEASAAVVGVMGGLSLAVQRHTRHNYRIPLASDGFHCLPGIIV